MRGSADGRRGGPRAARVTGRAGGGGAHGWRGGGTARAFRAPLAERSAVNRQVLGSIPSGGVPTRGSSVVEQWTVKCSMQRSIGREFKSPSPDLFLFARLRPAVYRGGGEQAGIFGLVGYDARFTRERSRVRSSEDVFLFFFIKKKNKPKSKKRQFSTRDSRMVPHCSTDRAQGCLSSQFGWDALCSP